jgi:tRNA-splicing ligase RtcB
MEEHEIDGKVKMLCVHRKGATRALPQGHKMLGNDLRETGQPVLVPGDMGRASFILSGDKEARDTFYSCAHGAGRLISRHAALKQGKGRDILDELLRQGITVKVRSKKLLSEEAPFAYKDVEDITNIVEAAGLARKVARLKPLAVVKG